MVTLLFTFFVTVLQFKWRTIFERWGGEGTFFVFFVSLNVTGLYLKILPDQNEIMRWMDVITILSLRESKWRRIFRSTNSLKLASTIIIFMEQVCNQCEK